ncbi:hypothetical protein Dimus_028207 [Dionaea muscipula]
MIIYRPQPPPPNEIRLPIPPALQFPLSSHTIEDVRNHGQSDQLDLRLGGPSLQFQILTEKGKMEGPMVRYQKLKLRESLDTPYRYPFVCKELGFILRTGYSRVPKNLQALILEDTLTAFRLLPQMQTESAVSAASYLIQSAESTLPKQKRAVAVKEFKKGKVAHKRRNKASKRDSGSLQLPQDVLLHVLSFLDMQSLVSAGLVCRSWYEAASENYLWQSHYSAYFGDLDSSAKTEWKEAFSRVYIGFPSLSRRFKFNRGYCGICDSIVWLNNVRCPNEHLVQRHREHVVKYITCQTQIVSYILDGYRANHYWDSDDFNSDDEFEVGFWDMPRVTLFR